MTGWVRSSFCAAGDCIEVWAEHDDRLYIRNSKKARGVTVTRAEFAAFVAGVKAGEFDHLTEPGR
jgi:Domain of unknown function (DUF397)